jgi:hypothetical protein
MRWVVLYSPSNFEKGSPAWRVEPLAEHIEMNLQALINDEDLLSWHVVGGVYKSFFEAGQYLDELKYRKDLNDNI